MKNLLSFVGGVWVVTTVYKIGEAVGETRYALREIKKEANDLRTKLKERD